MKVLSFYRYGSKVYGTATINSDEDFIAIIDQDEYNKQYNYQDYSLPADVSAYGVKTFQKMINEHDIVALECLFLPEHHKILEFVNFDFNLNLNTLRSAISAKSSNSFVKAKKKFTIEEDRDPYIAKKSLFHSLRIIIFGIQIAKFGKIVDYTESNLYWKEIFQNQSVDWEDYKRIYQPIYNNLKTEFRKLAAKPVQNFEFK